jgi:hypothetical protein
VKFQTETLEANRRDAEAQRKENAEEMADWKVGDRTAPHGLWSAVAERSVDTAFETVCGVEPTGDIASA